MTSLLARQALRSVSVSTASASRASCIRAGGKARTRTLHSSPIVQKKKKSAAFEDDMFGDGGDGDLFSDAPKPKKTKAKATATEPAKEPVVVQATSKKLSVEEKDRRFDELFEKLEAYLDKDIVGKARRRTPPLKHSIWTHMLQLATKKEQLERMTEVFGRWRDVTGSGLNVQFAELFVDRCTQLHCPHLSLRVFGDHAKYSLPLSLSAARGLLHSLHMLPPHGTNNGPAPSTDGKPTPTLSDVMAAAALYRVYDLKPIVTDLPSCAMILAACLRHAYPAGLPPLPKKKSEAQTTGQEGQSAGSEETATATVVTTPKGGLPKGGVHALTLVDAMLPQLKDLLSRLNPAEWAVPNTNPGYVRRHLVKVEKKVRKIDGEKVLIRTKEKEREKDWVRWCLKKVDMLTWKRQRRAGKGEGEGEQGRLMWLKEWREKAGHLTPGQAL